MPIRDIDSAYVGTAIPPLPDIGPPAYSLTDKPTLISSRAIAGGVGVDVMLIAACSCAPSGNISASRRKVDTNINTVRAGLGYKF